MSLIRCPECGKDVSDMAASCPNCGYPIATPKSFDQSALQKTSQTSIPISPILPVTPLANNTISIPTQVDSQIISDGSSAAVPLGAGR